MVGYYVNAYAYVVVFNCQHVQSRVNIIFTTFCVCRMRIVARVDFFGGKFGIPTYIALKNHILLPSDAISHRELYLAT